MLSVVVDEQARAEPTTELDELFRQGARRMLAAALEAEVEAYLAAHAELVDEQGHRLVVATGTPRRARWPPEWPGRGGPPAGGCPPGRSRRG